MPNGVLAGSGTQSDPYQIADRLDFLQFKTMGNIPLGQSLYIKQVADVVLLDSDKFAFTTTTGGVFFDTGLGNLFYYGDSFSIKNFNIEATGNVEVVIFSKGSLYDIVFEDLKLSSSGGSVKGIVDVSPIVKNVHVRRGNYNSFYQCAGIAYNVRAIEDCSFEGSISGRSYVGGIARILENGNYIRRCYFKGTIYNNGRNTGGIVGGSSSFSTGVIEDCYFNGTITTTGTITGGISALSPGSIRNCYVLGSITGQTNVGGIVGESNPLAVENCFNLLTSLRHTSNANGIFGDINTGTPTTGSVTNCYTVSTMSRSPLGTYKSLGSPVSPDESKDLDTYTRNHWDTERVWVKDISTLYPRLIKHVNIDLGPSYTHQMRYQRVVPHVDGTMSFMGITWKSKGSFYKFPDPPAIAPEGTVVEYEVGNLEHVIFDAETNKNIIVTFIASGVRDIRGAGGFSTYNTELKRETTVSSEYSAIVNFYFTEPKYLPSMNYKIQISTPDGIREVMARGNASGYAIRMQYGDLKLGIPTVSLGASDALPIHVMTDNGIEALQQWVEYSDIVMLND